jgi:hypothetical protein
MLGFLRMPEGRATPVKTDEDGRYALHLEEGRYRASPIGQLSQPDEGARYLSVTPGSSERVDLVVDPTHPTDTALSGVVLEPDGIPSAGALVIATGHNVRASLVADDAGRFTVSFVPEYLQATQGAEFAERRVDPAEREMTLKLGGTMSLRGKVVGIPPPSSFRLNVYPAAGSWNEAETIVFNGSTFELGDVRPGSVQVMVRTTDGRIGFTTARVPEGGTGDVEVTVDGTCEVVGRISAPAGSTGRPQASVRDDETGFWRWREVRADGSFRLQDLPRGTYTLSVRKGMWSDIRPVVLGESCPVDVGTLTLGPPGVPPGQVGVLASPGSPVVTGVLPGGPAQLAGLLPGDEILSVGGSPLASGEDLAERLSGGPGSSVTVTYRRSSVTYTVVVERAP